MFPLRDNIPSKHYPLMTLSLIMVNIIVFLYVNSMDARTLEIIYQNYALRPAYFDWQNLISFSNIPLVTSMFLHGGWLHIVGNMWALWLFGDNVEDRMGSFNFLAFYLLCGVVAGLTHIYVNPQLTTPTVGASGAVAGIMGAYFILFPRSRVLTLIPIFIIPWMVEIPAFIYLGFWFWLQITGGASGAGQIAFWAHVGGFITGMLLHRFFMRHSSYHNGTNQ